MTNVRRRWACLLALGVIFAVGAWSAPGARAAGPPTWQLAISARCSGGDVCLGATALTGDCTFFGTSSGTVASCQSMLSGDLGVFSEAIHGTAWDMEPGLLTPVTGVDEFFITDGTVTFAGGPIVGFIASGAPQALGCAVAGATITCPIPALEAAGLYSPDELDPVLVGHYASHVCFGSGVVDPSCSFMQQLTHID